MIFTLGTTDVRTKTYSNFESLENDLLLCEAGSVFAGQKKGSENAWNMIAVTDHETGEYFGIGVLCGTNKEPHVLATENHMLFIGADNFVIVFDIVEKQVRSIIPMPSDFVDFFYLQSRGMVFMVHKKGVFVKDDEVPKGPLKIDAAKVDETIETDFAIVGGGIPGVTAALAAARRGVKTAIIQDRPVLGGNASAEIRVWSAGEARYDLVREVRGWFMNGEGEMKVSDLNRMRIVEDEENLTTVLSTRVFAAEKNPDGSIASVKALDWKRNKIIRIKAKLFCDATGDGWLGYYAGADWRMGREAGAEFGEKYAPEKADDQTLGASLMWTSAEANTDMPFSAPWAEKYACGIKALQGGWDWEYGIRNDVIKCCLCLLL